MRVPGNERAFTVSPTQGIPFPQLVCIGETDGQSQAFPVSAWARPAAALLELARAPPRATVRSPGRDSVAAPTARSSRTHADPAHTLHCHVCPKPGPGSDPTPGSHARRCTRTGWVGGAQRRQGWPQSWRPRNRNREAGWAWGPRAASREALEFKINGRETPCAPWTHSCHLEAPGTRAGIGEWSPGSLVLCSPRAKAPGPGRTGWDGRVGEALSVSLGQASS